jgi:hypothetical protein
MRQLCFGHHVFWPPSSEKNTATMRAACACAFRCTRSLSTCLGPHPYLHEGTEGAQHRGLGHCPCSRLLYTKSTPRATRPNDPSNADAPVVLAALKDCTVGAVVPPAVLLTPPAPAAAPVAPMGAPSVAVGAPAAAGGGVAAGAGAGAALGVTARSFGVIRIGTI